MWKFLLGAAVVYLCYNQNRVIRGYYIVIHELNIAKRVAAEEKPIVYQAWKDVEAPVIDTAKQVQEPSLEQMQKLGFRVKKY